MASTNPASAKARITEISGTKAGIGCSPLRRLAARSDYSTVRARTTRPAMADTRKVSIFPIGAAELPRVRTLAYEIWPEAYAGILPPERIPGMLAEIYSLETLSTDISERQHRYWLATVDRGDA